MPDGPPSLPDVRIGNVLVPLDGSELALQALPTARALAARFDAALRTVTIADSEVSADQARALAAASLDVALDDERISVIDGGEPAMGIVELAESLEACLVCLGTHGRGRLRGALVGSVARSVLQRLQSPVVALGPAADNPGWSPRPRRWPEPLSVPRIVACVDGSTTSEEVLPLAVAWAAALEMELTIFTVIDDGRVSARADNPTYPHGGHADAGTYIEHLVERWGSTGAAIDGVVLRDPIGPASGLREHLVERPAGLVALTTHARSGLSRLRLGATAANIVHASVAPCLVAPVQG
jgi:nucleotide-binding universal stress UspA family protein